MMTTSLKYLPVWLQIINLFVRSSDGFHTTTFVSRRQHHQVFRKETSIATTCNSLSHHNQCFFRHHYLFSSSVARRKRLQYKHQQKQLLVCRSRLNMVSYDDDVFVKAQDGEALQTLFSKQCDKDGLMTKDILEKVPAIAELLSVGDLLKEELNDIWDAAPKFPTEDDGIERIDVDSFTQIYRDIDDLFEDDEEEDTTVGTATESTTKANEKVSKEPEVSNNSKQDNKIVDEDSADDVIDEDNKILTQIEEEDEEELEVTYKTICDKDGLLNYDGLKQWDEITKLFDDGLLGETEFNDIWDNTSKYPGSDNKLIDVNGFLSFNVALDDLFVFDDDDGDDNIENGETVSDVDSAGAELNVVDIDGDDDARANEERSPSSIFNEIANEKTKLVGMKELKRWDELQEMLADDELSQSELQSMFDDTMKAPGTNDMLDESGFISLYNAIDELFEEIDDDDDDDAEQEINTSTSTGGGSPGQQQAPPIATSNVKEELLAILANLNSDEERLPCGLESTDKEDEIVIDLVNDLEPQSTNKIRQLQGEIELSDLDGMWELLYSTSSAFRFNKGVSGLGGSFPNGKFGSLKQMLSASKYLTDMEYIEHIDVTPAAASFDVRINGDWQVNSDVSIFTGQPITVLRVVPDRVNYGPTSTRADHWKSVGPMNSLDVTYLDNDLRIMRGNTSTDTVFIFRRVAA